METDLLALHISFVWRKLRNNFVCDVSATVFPEKLECFQGLPDTIVILDVRFTFLTHLLPAFVAKTARPNIDFFRFCKPFLWKPVIVQDFMRLIRSWDAWSEQYFWLIFNRKASKKYPRRSIPEKKKGSLLCNYEVLPHIPSLFSSIFAMILIVPPKNLVRYSSYVSGIP